jgi:hypothetical protein
MFYVVGIGNLPGSDELAGYYYLTNPTGYSTGRRHPKTTLTTQADTVGDTG